MKDPLPAFTRLYQSALGSLLSGNSRMDTKAIARIGGQARDSTIKTNAGQTPRAPGMKRLVLPGMRERIEMIGGTFEIEAAPGLGTKIIARIPISKATERRWLDEPVEISPETP